MSYYRGMSKVELADELGFVHVPGRGYIDPGDYCGCGREHGDPECECEHEATTSKVVTARKARKVGTSGEVRPGDRVCVTSGFTYRTGGNRERTGYLPRTYKRLSCGPNWTDEEIAKGSAQASSWWNRDAWKRNPSQ
jgi:hypothetical protein